MTGVVSPADLAVGLPRAVSRAEAAAAAHALDFQQALDQAGAARTRASAAAPTAAPTAAHRPATAEATLPLNAAEPGRQPHPRADELVSALLPAPLQYRTALPWAFMPGDAQASTAARSEPLCESVAPAGQVPVDLATYRPAEASGMQMRLHQESGERGFTVWIGLGGWDGRAASLAPVLAELQTALAVRGRSLARVICNGHTVFEAQPTGAPIHPRISEET